MTNLLQHVYRIFLGQISGMYCCECILKSFFKYVPPIIFHYLSKSEGQSCIHFQGQGVRLKDRFIILNPYLPLTLMYTLFVLCYITWYPKVNHLLSCFLVEIIQKSYCFWQANVSLQLTEETANNQLSCGTTESQTTTILALQQHAGFMVIILITLQSLMTSEHLLCFFVQCFFVLYMYYIYTLFFCFCFFYQCWIQLLQCSQALPGRTLHHTPRICIGVPTSSTYQELQQQMSLDSLGVWPNNGCLIWFCVSVWFKCVLFTVRLCAASPFHMAPRKIISFVKKKVWNSFVCYFQKKYFI